MRRRLGEHGLHFDMITVPRSRPERTIVREVSGQLLVPVLIAEENGERLMFTDENDIHAYLDRRIGPMPAHEGQEPSRADVETLRQEAPKWTQMSDWLFHLAGSARQSGRLDEANCLHVAALNLRDAARWTGDHLPED